MPDGEELVMLQAILSGGSFPPDGVRGSPENRVLWDRITREVAALPEGVAAEVPFD
jgi:hypothetical protein